MPPWYIVSDERYTAQAATLASGMPSKENAMATVTSLSRRGLDSHRRSSAARSAGGRRRVPSAGVLVSQAHMSTKCALARGAGQSIRSRQSRVRSRQISPLVSSSGRVVYGVLIRFSQVFTPISFDLDRAVE